MPQPQSSSIDLSAGLQPASQAAPPPASSSGIDLSAGFQAKPPAPTPDWRDRLLSHLQSPSPVSTAGLPDNVAIGARALIGGAHAIGSMVLHPSATVKGTVQQVYDLANSPLPIPGVTIDAKTGQAKSASQQASVQHINQTAQQMVQEFKQDPAYAFGEVAAPFAAGEAVKPYLPVISKVVNAPFEAAKDVAPDMLGRGILGTGPGAARDLARKTALDNQAIQAATDKANASAAAAHQADLDSINHSNAQARAIAAERSKQLHMVAQNDLDQLNAAKTGQHAETVQRIQGENDAATQQAQQATQQARDEALAKHQQDMHDALDVEGQRGELARQAIQQKVRLANNVKKTAASVKTELGNGFDQVRDTVNDSGKPTITASPLVDATNAEMAKLADTTSDAAPHFNSIVNQFKSESMIEDMKNSEAQDKFGKNYDELDSNKKNMVDHFVTFDPESELSSDMTFGQLRRLSTKLGTAAYNSDDPYIASSMRNVKSVADALAQKMASDAGVGAQHAKLLQDWSHYKDVFEEPTGPSGSGSQVAQSVNAADAHHATAPFLADDDFVADRAKQLLVGKPKSMGGTYYNPQGGRLVEALRKTQSAQAELPSKPITVAPYEEPAAIAPKGIKPIPEPPTPETLTQAKVVQPGQESTPPLQPVPGPFEPKPAKLETVTPESLEQKNLQNATGKVAQLRQLTRFQVNALANAGFGLAYTLSHFLGGTSGSLLHGVGTYGAIGMAGLTAVRLLLDNDEILRKLSKPTVSEYSEFLRLPEDQRPGIQQAIQQLNDEALKSGKIKKPSPWIKAFNTFLQTSGPSEAAQHQQRQEQEAPQPEVP